MPQPVGSTIDMLLNLDSDTVIAGLLLAVLIAALTAGAYLWLRRGKSDVTIMLVSFILVANLACLVTGAGFIQWRSLSHRISAPTGGQENGQVRVAGRFTPTAGRWRRTAFSRPDRVKRTVNSKDAPVSPE